MKRKKTKRHDKLRYTDGTILSEEEKDFIDAKNKVLQQHIKEAKKLGVDIVDYLLTKANHL